MPPKKDVIRKEEDTSLSAVLVADNFDPRFAPLTQSVGPWCMQPICNIPLIDYTLSWILRTEIRKVILIASEKHAAKLDSTIAYWQKMFDQWTVVICKNALSVGDALRELDGRSILQTDFLLLSNPGVLTSSDLTKSIAKFRALRKENKNNVMTLVYAAAENEQRAVIGLEAKTDRLMIYHRQDDPTKLDVDKPHFIGSAVLRRDVTDSGIALCALNILAQFSDNFDFQNRDDVIREILVNEEILLLNIHIDVLSDEEAAWQITDYASLVLAGQLLADRWFYPLTPDQCCTGQAGFVQPLADNVYVTQSSSGGGRLSPDSSSCVSGQSCVVGIGCEVAASARLDSCSLGAGCTVGASSVLRECVLGRGCVVGSGCRLERVVLGDAVRIPDGVTIKAQSVVSANVSYPADYAQPGSVAVCWQAAEEDDDEMIKAEEKMGVHLWSLVEGGCWWRAGGARRERRDTETRKAEEEEEEGEDSDGEGEVELDGCAQFAEEVVESMERIQTLTFSDQQMHNLILEINSSKLAYNISMEDVARHVAASFFALPGNETFGGLKALISKWKLLFTNYYKPKKSQIQLLLAIEDRFHRLAAFAAMTPKLVHSLYNDDLLEEEAILEWAESIEDQALKKAMQPIIDWLEEDEDDSDEEESD